MTDTASGTVAQNQSAQSWIVLVEGIVAAVFGILMYIHPFDSLVALLAFLGWFWILEGIFGLVGLIVGLPVASKWWVGLLWTLSTILAAMFVLNQQLVNIYLARTLLVYTVAFMLIFSGVVSAASANRWSENRGSKWGITILALLFIVLGIILLFTPYVSFYIVVRLAALSCFAFGIVMIVYGALIRGGLAHPGEP